jgi:lipid-A-disaccharide synthase
VSDQQVNIFISTGEVSGDLQGATLVSALLQQAATRAINLKISALGGTRMEQAGAILLGDTRRISSIGLVEAIPQIIPTLNLQRQAKAWLQDNPPDLVVLIDYIGANKPLGEYIRRKFPHIPIVYYIAPQEWVCAFDERNSTTIASITDRLLAVFPEEARYYESFGINTTFIGHPLIDQLAVLPDRDSARQQLGIPPEQIAIVLSPASRQQELKYLLPIIFAAAQAIQQQIPQVHFWVPLAIAEFEPTLTAAIAEHQLNATIIPRDQGRVAIRAADLAITKSGTINLEMAILDVPQVVTYRLNKFTAWFARTIMKMKFRFASPVNLVLMRSIVPELLQENMNAAAITQTVIELIQPDRRAQLLTDYAAVRAALGNPGVCERAATTILDMLK